MRMNRVIKNDIPVIILESDQLLLTDANSALDLILSVKYETGCDRIAVNKAAVAEDFFILSTRLAGEILQKFINYSVKFAVYGDFSIYTSKPLLDFIGESNRGRDIFFAADAEDAAEKLSTAR